MNDDIEASAAPGHGPCLCEHGERDDHRAFDHVVRVLVLDGLQEDRIAHLEMHGEPASVVDHPMSSHASPILGRRSGLFPTPPDTPEIRPRVRTGVAWGALSCSLPSRQGCSMVCRYQLGTAFVSWDFPVPALGFSLMDTAPCGPRGEGLPYAVCRLARSGPLEPVQRALGSRRLRKELRRGERPSFRS